MFALFQHQTRFGRYLTRNHVWLLTIGGVLGIFGIGYAAANEDDSTVTVEALASVFALFALGGLGPAVRNLLRYWQPIREGYDDLG